MICRIPTPKLQCAVRGTELLSQNKNRQVEIGKVHELFEQVQGDEGVPSVPRGDHVVVTVLCLGLVGHRTALDINDSVTISAFEALETTNNVSRHETKTDLQQRNKEKVTGRVQGWCENFRRRTAEATFAIGITRAVLPGIVEVLPEAWSAKLQCKSQTVTFSS